MKYGVLFSRATQNLGDDIQSYAQTRFLPRVDYYIDRETAACFQNDPGEEVICIMNAWYMHQPFLSWPPSRLIRPLFLSAHFDPSLEQELSQGINRDYLESVAPVGCRDFSTVKMMERIGIAHYYSGCMTLTLEPDPGVERGDYICLVDISAEVMEYVKSSGLPYREYTHQYPELYQQSPEDRMNAAKDRLKVYREAKCVITSRLHCALPCLALQTPVLVEYQDQFKERFSGLNRLFRSYPCRALLDDGVLEHFIENPEPNSDEYISLRQGLEERCQIFIAEADTAGFTQAGKFNPGLLYTHLSERFAEYFHLHRAFYEHWNSPDSAARMREELREAWGFVKKYEDDQKEKNKSLGEAWGLVKKYEDDQKEKNNSLGEAWGLVKKYEEDQKEKNNALDEAWFLINKYEDDQKERNNSLNEAWSLIKKHKDSIESLESDIVRMEKRYKVLHDELERIQTSPFWSIYQKTLKKHQ